MKFSILILPGTNCIEAIIHVFKQVMRNEIASLLHKDHDLPAIDFTVNSLNA
jgi:hypothetical protein